MTTNAVSAVYNYDIDTILESLHEKNEMLISAVYSRNVTITKLLLDKGANADQKCLLPAAVCNGDIEIAKLLIEYGASVSDGGALSTACYYNNLDIIRMLLDFRTPICCNGYAIILMCSLRGQLDALKLILANNVVLTSVLERAVENAKKHGHYAVVSFLSDRLGITDAKV